MNQTLIHLVTAVALGAGIAQAASTYEEDVAFLKNTPGSSSFPLAARGWPSLRRIKAE